jgi:hypothetical protein
VPQRVFSVRCGNQLCGYLALVRGSLKRTTRELVWLRSCFESADACAAVLRPLGACVLVPAVCLSVLNCVVVLMLFWPQYKGNPEHGGDCDCMSETVSKRERSRLRRARHERVWSSYVLSSSGCVATFLQNPCNVSFQITIITTRYFRKKGICIR